MLARGIRSYHRPTRVEDALALAAQGMAPLAGGTRLLTRERELPNVLDLSALGWSGIRVEEGDLVIGATTPLEDVIDSPLAYPATAGLLPAACRARSASRLRRGMATLGGESIDPDPDSEVAAALLALNALYRVVGPEGEVEVPALRFLKGAAQDLAGGALLRAIAIPGPPPKGAALRRVAVLPSAPPLVSVAATLAYAGEVVVRARLAFTGLAGPPARLLEAEGRLEGTQAEAEAAARAAEQVETRGAFRDDALASSGYRRRAAAALVRRAVAAAVAESERATPVPRLRPASPTRRPTQALPYFTSGRVELTVDGRPLRAEAEARTTLLDLLRREGFRGVKRGCERGECGACAVLLDGRPVNACLTLALRAHGRNVQTVEGLGAPGAPHAVQRAFLEGGAIGCGYCTPASELLAKALLDAIPDPTEDEARQALAGCVCDCTGYARPVAAVLAAGAHAARSGAAGGEPGRE